MNEQEKQAFAEKWYADFKTQYEYYYKELQQIVSNDLLDPKSETERAELLERAQFLVAQLAYIGEQLNTKI